MNEPSDQPGQKIEAFYLNPVYRDSFADPYVLKYNGEYWAYSTGIWRDGRCFGVLRSRDLVHWHDVGGAMEPLAGDYPCYWAPEILNNYGRLLMYYSVGDEEKMQIRVAEADHPAGPFLDSGTSLTHEEFAIDPHVFIDEDGEKYMFYATDFLTHTHIGTATVVDRMINPFTLAGDPHPVARAQYDWQVYDPNRIEKGGVRWYTIEGPSVLKRKSRYYQMFSAGNWKNVSYGVSYAYTDDIRKAEEWRQVSDGISLPPILRSVPGKVIGPGHNSVIRGPDNRQLYCIYHAWTQEGRARSMCIDPLDWIGRDIIVLGPSDSQQPAPIEPSFADYFSENHAEGLGENWECIGGRWSTQNQQAIQDCPEGNASARAKITAREFISEFSVRSMAGADVDSGCGISLFSEGRMLFLALLLPEKNLLSVSLYDQDQAREERLPLPPDFLSRAFHLFRVDVNGIKASIQIDQGPIRWEGRLSERVESISLITKDASAAFAGFALTTGWEDLFEQQTENPADYGWDIRAGEWLISGGELWQRRIDASEMCIVKSTPSPDYEFVVNARLLIADGNDSGFGFYPVCGARSNGPRFLFKRQEEQWGIVIETPDSVEKIALPREFDPSLYHQFRFRKVGKTLQFGLAPRVLGRVKCELESSFVGLITYQAIAAFEMARVTTLPRASSTI